MAFITGFNIRSPAVMSRSPAVLFEIENPDFYLQFDFVMFQPSTF